MDLTAILKSYDRQLRQEMTYPDAIKQTTPLTVRFLRPAPAMSFVLYSMLSGDTADAAIAEQADFFARDRRPFTWKVYDHDSPADLKDRLVSHGFVQDDEPASIMVLDLGEASPALLAPVAHDIRRLQDRSQLGDVVSVLDEVWGGDFGWVHERLGGHMQVPGYLSVYVCHVDRRPVSVAWTYFPPGADFATLWAGSTLSSYRKRGLYTALLATRTQEARARGCRYLVIEAGSMSRPIVEKHGFRHLTTMTDYLLAKQ